MPELYSRHMFGVLKVFTRHPKTRALKEIGRLSTAGVDAKTIEEWFNAIVKPYKVAA